MEKFLAMYKEFGKGCYKVDNAETLYRWWDSKEKLLCGNLHLKVGCLR